MKLGGLAKMWGRRRRSNETSELLAHGQTLIAAGDWAAAEQALRNYCARFPHCAELWALLGKACWNKGDVVDALRATDRALALQPHESLATQKGWMLLERGHLGAAEIALRDAIARFPEDRSAPKLLAQLYKRAQRWNDAAAAAEQACGLDPADPDIWALWADSLLAAERPDKALAVIETALDAVVAPAAVAPLLTRKAATYGVLNDPASEIETLRKLIALQPENAAALERLCLLMLTNGGSEQAQSYRDRLHKLEAEDLPERLDDGLAAIWQRIDAVDLDDAAVAWAWELADQAGWQRTAWRRQAAWGKEANLLMHRWWRTVPAKELRQLDDLLDAPDLTELHAAALEGRGCIVAGAHVGLPAPLYNALGSGNRPFHTFGSPGRDRPEGTVIIAGTSESGIVVRTLIERLKNGATIGMLADVPLARTCIGIEFLGRQVELPTIVPRLVQSCGVPSFWGCPLWRGGRISFQLRRLPDALPDEPRDHYIERWFTAYLTGLEGVMRGHPKNLNLVSGIWSNVNRSVLLRRKSLVNRTILNPAAEIRAPLPLRS